MDWVDAREEKSKEEYEKGYFNFVEGANKVLILSHCAPLAQKWTGTKYEPAEEGDQNVSVKGVCWVLHEGLLKQAKLPYLVVKAIRALQNDSEWGFNEFPMRYPVTINAKGAGKKEVEYTVVPSPKEMVAPAEILNELAKKPKPEEIVEKIKGKKSSIPTANASEYPAADESNSADTF